MQRESVYTYIFQLFFIDFNFVSPDCKISSNIKSDPLENFFSSIYFVVLSLTKTIFINFPAKPAILETQFTLQDFLFMCIYIPLFITLVFNCF